MDKGTECAGDFKSICSAEKGQLYSTLSETKVVFDKSTERSFKTVVYRFLGGDGLPIFTIFLYLSQSCFSETCLIDLIPQNVQNFDSLSIPYSKPLAEFGKPKFKIGDSVHVSKFEIFFRWGYKLKFMQKLFEIFAISPNRPPPYTIRDEKTKKYVVTFTKKSWSKTFSI